MNDSPAHDKPMNIRRILARGASIAFIFNAIGVVLLYGTHVLLTRWMGGEERYGLFAYSFSWAQLLQFQIGLGLPTAVLRFMPQYLEDKDAGRMKGLMRAARGTTTIVGLVIAAGGMMLAWQLADEERRLALVIGMGLSPLLAVAFLQRQLLRGLRQIAMAVGPAQVGVPAILLATAGFLYFQTGDLLTEHALLILAGAFMLVILVQAGALWKTVPAIEGESNGATQPIYEWRKWLSVGFTLLLVQQSLIILRQTDVVMLGLFTNDSNVGRYAVAARTADLGGFALRAMNIIAAPMIGTLFAKNDHAGLQRMAQTAAKWVFWPSLAIACALAFAAEPVLSLFGTGNAYTEAKYALGILLCGQVLSAAFGPVGYVLNLTGHHQKVLGVYVATAVLNIALNAILIPTFGIEGAACATAVTLAIRNTIAFIFVKKYLGFACFAWVTRPQK